MKKLSKPFRPLHAGIKSFAKRETFLPACFCMGRYLCLEPIFPRCHELLRFLTSSLASPIVFAKYMYTILMVLDHPLGWFNVYPANAIASHLWGDEALGAKIQQLSDSSEMLPFGIFVLTGRYHRWFKPSFGLSLLSKCLNPL